MLLWMPQAAVPTPELVLPASLFFRLLAPESLPSWLPYATAPAAWVCALSAHWFVDRQGLSEESTYVTAMVFLVLLSMAPGGGLYSPATWAALFFMLSLRRLFRVLDEKRGRDEVVHAGFLLGVAMLFHLWTIILIPLYAAVLVRFRSDLFREILLLLVSVILPAFFLGASLLFAEKTDAFIAAVPDFSPELGFQAGILGWTVTAWLALLIIFGMTSIARSGLLREIRYRRIYQVLVLLMLLLPVLPAVSPGKWYDAMPLVMAPASWMGGIFWSRQRLGFWSRAAFGFMILVWMASQLWPLRDRLSLPFLS